MSYAGGEASECRAEYQKAKRTGDYQSIVDICGQIAEAGDAESQFFMGVLYKVGNVLPHQEEQALIWFKKAAENGHVMGQFEMIRHFIQTRPLNDMYMNLVMAYSWQCVLERQLTMPDIPGKAMWLESENQSKFLTIQTEMDELLKKHPIKYGWGMKYMCWAMLKESYPTKKSNKAQ